MTAGSTARHVYLPAMPTFDVRNPATSKVIARVPDGTTNDAARAVLAASMMFPAWAATPPRQRGEILRRAYEFMVDDVERLAGLVTSETGKSEADARAEVRYAADFFRWYGEEAVRTEGTYGDAPAGGARTIVTHRPVGVSASR